MRPVSVVGIGWIPIEKENALSLKDMGVRAARMALEDAGVEGLDEEGGAELRRAHRDGHGGYPRGPSDGATPGRTRSVGSPRLG